MKKLLPLAALALLTPLVHAPAVFAQASANLAAGKTQPSPLAPGEIVAAAPKGDWVMIPASDLLVMDLAPNPKGKPRRVVIQLMPAPFSQGWIGNIRLLAKAHWWDGLSINRVQDNYVVQWGDANGENKAKARALPSGLTHVPETDYETKKPALPSIWTYTGRQEMPKRVAPVYIPATARFSRIEDPYEAYYSFFAGFPLAVIPKIEEVTSTDASTGVTGTGRQSVVDTAWPVHCYGMVGVGRDMPPNTGSGAELYVVIGHAPRHLDRNIALVGRVIEGIEHLSSLPRGTGGLGFYETAAERTTITAIRIGNDVSGLPSYEYLSTESASFAKYADARANRRDAFFIRPAGGADICNIPVPVRRAK